MRLVGTESQVRKNNHNNKTHISKTHIYRVSQCCLAHSLGQNNVQYVNVCMFWRGIKHYAVLLYSVGQNTLC